MLIISKSMGMSIISTWVGRMNLSIIFCIPLLSPLRFLMLLTFLNDLLINLFLFIKKPIHNDKLQTLVFLRNIIY